MLEKIQSATDLTLDEIAAKVGYAGSYVRRTKTHGGGEKLESKLMSTFSDIIQKDTPKDHTNDIVELLKTNNKDLRHYNQDLKGDKEFLQRMLESNLDKLTSAVSTLAGLSKEQISYLANDYEDIKNPFEYPTQKKKGKGLNAGK